VIGVCCEQLDFQGDFDIGFATVITLYQSVLKIALVTFRGDYLTKLIKYNMKYYLNFKDTGKSLIFNCP